MKHSVLANPLILVLIGALVFFHYVPKGVASDLNKAREAEENERYEDAEKYYEKIYVGITNSSDSMDKVR